MVSRKEINDCSLIIVTSNTRPNFEPHPIKKNGNSPLVISTLCKAPNPTHSSGFYSEQCILQVLFSLAEQAKNSAFGSSCWVVTSFLGNKRRWYLDMAKFTNLLLYPRKRSKHTQILTRVTQGHKTNILYFTTHNTYFWPNFWGKNKDTHYTCVALILYLYKCF